MSTQAAYLEDVVLVERCLGRVTGAQEAAARDLFRRPMQPLDLKNFDGLCFDPPRAGAERAHLVAAFGQCATACLTVDDCASPYVCDPTQRCVAPPDIASGSECAAVPGSPRGLGAWAALLALLGGATLYRRRSRAAAAPR